MMSSYKVSIRRSTQVAGFRSIALPGSLDRLWLTVRLQHMAPSVLIGETGNGLNPLGGLAKFHASRQR